MKISFSVGNTYNPPIIITDYAIFINITNNISIGISC